MLVNLLMLVVVSCLFVENEKAPPLDYNTVFFVPDSHLIQVHFLRYLNSLYHDDYPAALENLHRYFDYR